MTLRRRIFLFYISTLGVALLVVGAFSYHELQEQLDRMVNDGMGEALKNTALEETVEILLFGGVPAIILGVIIGACLMHRALRPIQQLTDALEYTDVSNLSQPVPRSGNGDELDRMSAVFNGMKDRLGHSFTQAREFTLHASHELKTPLTILHSTLEQMHGDIATPAAQRERIASMLEEVQRLSSIVGQLAFLAKADAGLLTIVNEPVALHELVRDLAEDTVILAASAGITVALSECATVEIRGDHMRLRQLLLNLADNAVKYNERGGSIEMTLCRQGDEAVFTIMNTGLVLPAALSARVFERFFRGDLAHNSATEGSGLGLSIAKSIVEAHQGSIRYEVHSDGRTQVTVMLPA